MIPLFILVTYYVLNSSGTGVNSIFVNTSNTIPGLLKNENPATQGLASSSEAILIWLLLLGVLSTRIQIVDAGLVASFLAMVSTLILAGTINGLIDPNLVYLFIALTVVFFVVDALKGSTRIY